MKRTVSTAHLIFGIIFAGIAALWMIRQATDASIHDTAPGFPLVLIGAGLVGLVASLVNSRTRKQSLIAQDEVDETNEPDQPAEPAEPADETTEATTVIEEN